ncbi:MAG: 1-(5-phosphoribosyl)-5-[(5-phosphoribosylamino)methylideneamino]imidazole-4-carboxamide isomerase [Thaumarchaeota archaeon]|nr:1-(5-phosphoribosyl)-5-[(5-phosphoribosylamino)methylideneamino]imidazole-4-carboxamide isomerase [Nitrososphaerota archaeon]
MKVIPSIDLMKGQVVRLIQGDPNRATVYGINASNTAKKYEELGANALHVVDLDATLSRGNNLNAIRKVREKVSASIQVGGGIRSIEYADNLVEMGIDKLVIGTVALEKRELFKEMLSKIGNARIVVALDYKGEQVVTRGWTRKTGLRLLDALDEISALGVTTFLLTCMERDGMLIGPDVDVLKEAKRVSGAEIQASGGVSNIKDVEKLMLAGVDAVIIGKALYERKIRLEDAIALTEGVKAK